MIRTWDKEQAGTIKWWEFFLKKSGLCVFIYVLYQCLIILLTRQSVFLTTGGTAVWFFSNVAGFMLQKLSVRVEGFSTLVTCECLVGGVGPLVLLKITQVVESWATWQVQSVKHQSYKHKMCHHFPRYHQPFIHFQLHNEIKTCRWTKELKNFFCLEQFFFFLPRPHISHRCGFSPVWTTLWRWTSPEAVKLEK